MSRRMVSLMCLMVLLGGCVQPSPPTTSSPHATSPPAQACQTKPTPGKTRTIQVVLVRIPKEDVDRYPELLEKRVGFGINSILVETLFDAQRFRFLEEKETILKRLVEQQILTENGVLYRDKVKEGLPAPELLAYADIFDFVSCSQEEVIRLMQRQLACTTKVSVQVRIVETATGEYLPGSAQGEHTQRAAPEGIWGKLTLPFDQSAVGKATWQATCGAVNQVLQRLPMKGW